MSILASDPSQKGTYNIRIIGYQHDVSIRNDFIVQVQIDDNCPMTIVTIPPDETIFYELGITALSWSLPEFTESLGYCGNFEYTLTYDDNGPIDPSLYSFELVNLILTM